MKKKNTAEKQLASIEQGLSKTEQFIENNSKILFSIIGIIVFMFVAYYGYKNLYSIPLNKTAQKQLFVAEQYFEKDSFKTALHGTEEFDGLLTIVKKYSSTKSGSLAKYYAGISYLNIGEYKDAIRMLEKYNSDDLLLLSISKIAIGDAFSEINQPEEAIEYYEKAMAINKNNLTTPIVLIKCAKLYESQKKYIDALECYKTIKENYPESTISKTMDKYINNLNSRLENN